MKGIGIFYTSIGLSIFGLCASLLISMWQRDNTVVKSMTDYHISKSLEDFVEQLNVTVSNAPVRRNQRKQLIVIITDHETVELSLNALCSIRHAGIATNDYVFVALDEYSYVDLVNANATTIHYPMSILEHSTNPQDKAFADVSRIRPIIALEVVKMGADVVMSNADIVLFDDPTILFDGTGDFEVQVDSKTDAVVPDSTSIYWSINMGFYKMKASPRARAFAEAWRNYMLKDKTVTDHAAFRKLVKNYPLHSSSTNEFEVDITSLMASSSRERMRIRYLDPLLAVNAAGALLGDTKLWEEEAERRSIKRPVLCRFFHIGDVNAKKRVLKQKKLWYLNYKSECKKNPPSGSQWKRWK